MSTGLDIGFDCYYDYIYGRVSIENVDIEGIENDSFTGMFVSSYGSKIPKGNIFKASNCKIHNFNYKDYEGVALQAEVSEETADKVVFENITMADNNYGIIAKKNRLTKLPIIKNCIIAGNKKGFDFNNEIDTSSITYSCIYNDSWNGNTYGYGEGCIFTDPLFADSKNGDFHLMSKAGRYGGTYAHKDIAFEFGMWISPKFKLLLIKEFERLKAEEQKQLGWNAKRELSKINYRIHTDAIKQNLIPNELTKEQINYVYAEEADVLNMALFGMTAKEWRNKNKNLDGNIRDHATINELICLANLENLNSVFINDGLNQSERLVRLNKIAISQMKILNETDIKYLNSK